VGRFQARRPCFTSYRTGPKDYTTFGPDGEFSGTSTDID
jgi:hypothetical protein